MRWLYLLPLLLGASVFGGLRPVVFSIGRTVIWSDDLALVVIPSIVLAYCVGLWFARRQPLGWHGVGHVATFTASAWTGAALSPPLRDEAVIFYIILGAAVWLMLVVGLVVHRVGSALSQARTRGSSAAYAAALVPLAAAAAWYLWWIITWAGNLAFSVPWMLGAIGLAIFAVVWAARRSRAPNGAVPPAA